MTLRHEKQGVSLGKRGSASHSTASRLGVLYMQNRVQAGVGEEETSRG